MKKAQLQHAFVYIMAAIVIGFIVVMGFNYINVIISKKCDVEMLDFKSDLDRYIDKYSAYGSYVKEELNAPCDYEQVCFVDTTAIKEKRTLEGAHSIIVNSVEKGVEQNMFLLKDKVEPIGYNPKIALADPARPLCIERKSGYFNVGFRGQGRTTKLEAVQ